MYKTVFTSFINVRKVLTLLGNLKLAIILLLTLALFSGLGTIIEQSQSVQFYETNYPATRPILGFINSDLILILGLNKIYTNWWFLFIIFLFGSSLLSCTFSRQIPSLKLAKLWRFFKEEQNLNKFNLSFTLKEYSLAEFAYFLRKEQYHCLQQGGYLYAYKGLIGKIGPIIVHISIIFVLVGSVYGALAGFMAQEIIPTDTLFHLQNIVTSGPISYVNQEFQGYVNDFKIAYTDEGVIDQFYSDLAVLDQELNVQVKKTIFVNEPLKYKDLTVYQTDWNIEGVEVLLNEKEIYTLPLKEIKLKTGSRFWIATLPINKNNLLVIQDLTGQYLIYNQATVLLGEAEIGHKLYVAGQSLRLTKILPSTGLQIKSDPGIPIVYGGFLLLIVSASISYTSYCQIWAIKKSTKLYIYGITNRGVYFFEKQLIGTLSNLRKSEQNIQAN